MKLSGEEHQKRAADQAAVKDKAAGKKGFCERDTDKARIRIDGDNIVISLLIPVADAKDVRHRHTEKTQKTIFECINKLRALLNLIDNQINSLEVQHVEC